MKKKRRKKRHVLLTILVILILIGLSFVVFTIRNVEVEGNKKYSDQEITDFILTDKYDYHTLYFYLKSKFTHKKEIPYIEDYDIRLVSLNTIKITVYEKSLIGCVDYMGSYMCFDKDGMVVETSGTLLEGVPLITGLDFQYVVVNEELPIADKKVFDLLLDITQMIKKYNITADKIDVSPTKELTLYMANVKVELGTNDFNKKLADLKDIESHLAGKSGTLNMKTYDTNNQGYSFKTDNSE